MTVSPAEPRTYAGLSYPMTHPLLRRHHANILERCPECGGDLSGDWSCEDCRFDAIGLVPEEQSHG